MHLKVVQILKEVILEETFNGHVPYNSIFLYISYIFENISFKISTRITLLSELKNRGEI